MRKYLRMSKKSSTFALAFSSEVTFIPPWGPRKSADFWGERRHKSPVYLAEWYKPLRSCCRTRPAGWMSDLVSGLQNRIERFDSATGLQAARKWAALIFTF